MFFRKKLALLAALTMFTGPVSASAESGNSIELKMNPVGSSASASSADTASTSRTVKLPSRGLKDRNGREAGSFIGRVGIVTQNQSPIFRAKQANATVLFKVDKDTPLAVMESDGDWHGILMVDGSMGWMRSASLKMSDYRLVSDPTRTYGSGNERVNLAMTYMGVPYVWGGNTRAGLDCSGLVKQVWNQYGINLPRTAREQATVGTPVGINELQAGDRLYFICKGSVIDHTGIYIGNNTFIHASSSRRGVGLDQLTGKWQQWFVGARRD